MCPFRRFGVSAPRMGSASPFELPPNDEGSILVAVDGKPQAWDALEWAAAEAASRRCELRIMHVCRWSPALVGAPLVYPVEEWNVGMIETVQEILTEAENRARSVAPNIQITVGKCQGAATDEILREGKRDALIVLGRGRTGGRIRTAVSVGRRVTRRATAPVAIITLATSMVQGQSAGRVVVGIEGTEDVLQVLGFAFRSAQRRGVGVTLVHEHPSLDRTAIRICKETYSDVNLIQKISSECSPISLVGESMGAALLVVGDQRRRARRFAFRSPRDALKLAQCPIAIVKSIPSITRPAKKRFESAAG
jgi:nucleotide-binding universal stress UspA family protein